MFTISPATHWWGASPVGAAAVVFLAVLAVAGDVHVAGEGARPTAAARRRYLALQRRSKGDAAMELARGGKDGGSARFGGATKLCARPWAFAHPSHPLSWVHGDGLAPVVPHFWGRGKEREGAPIQLATWWPTRTLVAEFCIGVFS